MVELSICLISFLLSLFSGSAASQDFSSLTITSQEVFRAKSSQILEVNGRPTLESLFTAQGVDSELRHKILFHPQFPKRFYLLEGEKYAFHKGLREGEFMFTFFEDFLDRVFEVAYFDGKLHLWNRAGGFEFRTKTLEGEIHRSLFESFMQHVPNEALAHRFKEAFHNDYDLSRLEKGARFKVTYQEKYYLGQLVKYGEVLEAQLDIQGETKFRRFIGNNQQGSFVGVDNADEAKPLFAPVSFPKITSLFSKRRFHPIRHRYIAHLGMDYELPEGWPVLSAGDGTIVRLEKNKASGRLIMIKHKNELSTYYLHMHAFNPALRVGSVVKAGDWIGKIGCTGYCTKPHLHFAVKKNNVPVDPSRFTRAHPLAMQSKVLLARERLANTSYLFTQMLTK